MMTTKLADLRAMLESYGDRFAGNNPADEAAEWDDHGFTAASAAPWCAIGVWDAGTADEFVAAGLSPEQVEAAAERLVEGVDDAAERYTDGDPIYAACNGDIRASEIIEAATPAGG